MDTLIFCLFPTCWLTIHNYINICVWGMLAIPCDFNHQHICMYLQQITCLYNIYEANSIYAKRVMHMQFYVSFKDETQFNCAPYPALHPYKLPTIANLSVKLFYKRREVLETNIKCKGFFELACCLSP